MKGPETHEDAAQGDARVGVGGTTAVELHGRQNEDSGVTVYRVSWRDGAHHPHHTDYVKPHAAYRHRDRLERKGLLVFVYEIAGVAE